MGKLDQKIGKQATKELEKDLEAVDLLELGDRANKQLDEELKTINYEFDEGVAKEDKEEVIGLAPSDVSVEGPGKGEVIDVDSADVIVEDGEVGSDQDAEDPVSDQKELADDAVVDAEVVSDKKDDKAGQIKKKESDGSKEGEKDSFDILRQANEENIKEKKKAEDKKNKEDIEKFSPDQEAEELILGEKEMVESHKKQQDKRKQEENMESFMDREGASKEELLKREMEESYQELTGLQGKFVKAQEGKKKLNKLRALLGGAKSKEATEAAKDFDNIEEEYEKAKEGFRDKFGAFGLNLVNGKRFELEKEGEEGKELKYKLLEFMHTEEVIDSGEKDKKGESIKRSISEEYNQRLFDLDSAKIEKFSSKTRQICRNFLGKYQKLPKAKKIALGTALALTVGVATGAVGTIGAATVYGGQRVARSYIGGLFGGVASAGTNTVYETAQGAKNVKKGKTEKDFRRRGKEGLAEQIKTTVDGNDDGQDVEDAVKEGLLKGVENQKKVLDEMNEYQRKQLRNRMIAAGMVGVVAGGGVVAIADGMVDTDSIFGTKPKAEIGQTRDGDSHIIRKSIENKDQGSAGPGNAGGESDDAVGEASFERVKIIPDEDSTEVLRAVVQEQEQEQVVDFSGGNETAEELKVVPGEPIELEKGDSIWGTLKNRNLSDREIMNKVNLLSKQIGESLVADGVSPEQAKEFINWRFGHMDVGENFIVDESGNLVVDDFLSKSKLDQFGISSNDELGVIDTSEINADESLSSRLDDGDEPTGQGIEKHFIDEGESVDGNNGQEPVTEKVAGPVENITETVDLRGEISSLSGSEKGFIVEKLAENKVDSKVFDQINGSSAGKVMDSAAQRLRELSKASMSSGETANSLDIQRTMGLLRHMKQTVEPIENETFAQYVDRYSSARNFRMDEKDLERLSNVYKQAYLAGSGESLNVANAPDPLPENDEVIGKVTERGVKNDGNEVPSEAEKIADERSVEVKKNEIFEKRPSLKVFDSFENFLENNGEELNYRSVDVVEQWQRFKETTPKELMSEKSFQVIDQRMQRVGDAMDESNTSVALKQLGLISRRFANLDQNHEFLIRGTELAEKMGIEYDPYDPSIVNKMENGILTEIDGYKVSPEFLTDEEIEKVNEARAISGKELMEKGVTKTLEEAGEVTESFQESSINVDKETFEKVGKFSPKQVEDVVFEKGSGISNEGKDFMRTVIATNLNAKAGESFEEYLERYFENENIPEVTQEDLKSLGEIYEKMWKE
ncbi:MAG: hypothetical protein U9O20_04610 [Patescibacteria group bacterium]|nr:hypothetical protein [Patescibacteria group bacterium]